MHKILRCSIVGLTLLIATPATAEPVRCVVVRKALSAQMTEAQVELDELKKQFNDETKSNEDRVKALEALYRRFPLPVAGIQLVEVERAQGHHDEVARLLWEISRQEPAQWSGAPEQHEQAVRKARSSLASLPEQYRGHTLLVEALGAASRLEIQVDGMVCKGMLDIPPGDRKLQWSYGGKQCEGKGKRESLQSDLSTIEIDVGACGEQRVPAPVNPKGPRKPSEEPGGGQPPSPPPHSSLTGEKVLFWGGLGVGVLGVGAAAYFHFHAYQLKKDADCADARCWSTGANDIESARASKDWRTAGMVLGGVGLAGAAVGLILWHPWRSNAREPTEKNLLTTSWIAPTYVGSSAGLSLGGRF